jgi:hypothetical protein
MDRTGLKAELPCIQDWALKNGYGIVRLVALLI